MAFGYNNTLITAAFWAISQNEVGSKSPFQIIAPKPGVPGNGVSGYALGYLQDDFSGNPDVAQNLLVEALVASGQYTETNAASVARQFTRIGVRVRYPASDLLPTGLIFGNYPFDKPSLLVVYWPQFMEAFNVDHRQPDFQRCRSGPYVA